MARIPGHVVGVDDAPFAPGHRGDVPIIGVLLRGTRLDGVLTGRVRRDGRNATRQLAKMVESSPFYAQRPAVMLQGITLAGFNVVDLEALHDALGLPVLAVARRAPNLDAIRNALLAKVPGGPRKWRLIEKAGPMEPLEGVFVQRAGVRVEDAVKLLRQSRLEGRKIPEPLRMAHLIAGALATGTSRGGA